MSRRLVSSNFSDDELIREDDKLLKEPIDISTDFNIQMDNNLPSPKVYRSTRDDSPGPTVEFDDQRTHLCSCPFTSLFIGIFTTVAITTFHVLMIVIGHAHMGKGASPLPQWLFWQGIIGSTSAVCTALDRINRYRSFNIYFKVYYLSSSIGVLSLFYGMYLFFTLSNTVVEPVIWKIFAAYYLTLFGCLFVMAMMTLVGGALGIYSSLQGVKYAPLNSGGDEYFDDDSW